MEIKSVAVIGSGVMGSGIAGQIANAGYKVMLLDIVPKDAADRSALARGAIERMLKTDPAPLMTKSAAKLITPGNTEDDFDTLKEVDWIVEVIVENLDIKKKLYERIEKVRKPGCIVSSNTSTIPLHLLVEGRSEDFAKHFLITHFFNPPRYMRLLELVTGPKTGADVAATVREFCDVKLGKGVVKCNDTPGFIANRIGTLWMQAGVNAAIDLGLTVEEADAIAGRPMGIPKTGIFSLIDLVGLDLMPHLAKSLLSTLPPNDAYRSAYRDVPLFAKMIADGYTGRKGKGGFIRMSKSADGARVKEAIDLKTGNYRPAIEKPDLPSIEAGKKGLRALVESPDKGGRYAWALLSQGLSYAADLVPEIADDIVAVDEAMKLGYGWKNGPFAMIDALGASWFAERLQAEGLPVPKMLKVANGRPFYRTENGVLEHLTVAGDYKPVARAPGVLLLSDIKRKSKPVLKNGSAAVWDIGDGVLCFEFTSKMNTLDPDIMALLEKTIATINGSNGAWKALVIHNEGENFSVGANLGLFIFAINIALWPQVESGIEAGQKAYRALKFANFPVVGAPSGMALGGGCEILLHCDAIQAAAETYIGLVEGGVGVVPGWGGCKEMLIRHWQNKKRPGGPMPPIAKVFEIIGTAQVSKSAAEAKEMLFLRAGDGVSMNKDRLLADAKARALALVEGYKPPEPVEMRLPGPTAKAAFKLAVADQRKLGRATPHDVVVVDALAEVLSGGAKADFTLPTKEDAITSLERAAFMKLVRTPGTIARIEHMLETGKPLRN
jgi:3-hydroxyacyl-CoA dehydrogenase